MTIRWLPDADIMRPRLNARDGDLHLDHDHDAEDRDGRGGRS